MKSPSLKSKKEHVGLLIRDGQPAAAKSLLEEIVRSDRHDADTWYMLAAVNHGLGIRDEAARCYEKTIILNPIHPEAHYYLGNIRGENKDYEGAIRCYRKALQLRPQFADAARNLGAILHDLQRTHEAIDCYNAFLEQGPASADIYFNLGNALADIGAYESAVTCYRRALALDPARSEAYINLGIALDLWGELDEAVVQYETALSVDPTSIPACRCLGAALAEQGKPEEAMARYRQALLLAPDDGLKLRLALTLPVIPESLEDLTRWRKRLETGIACLEKEPINLSEPAKEVAVTNFYLSYHGLSNRELHINVAKLYERACPSLLWTAPHCAKPMPRSGKIRVAFISCHMHDHSIGKTTRGLLANLSREHFEVFSLFVQPLREDETTKFIRAKSDKSVVLPRVLDAARRVIAELKLDILFYQDIGMDPFTYFLAFSRLAPVQCLSFGHPDTTGIANMDYFVSNDLFEPTGAAQHYSERLFLLHDLGTLAYYYRPRLPDIMKRREEFGLPAEANLYLCPQTLFKFHPEFDVMLGDILRADPRGRLVLIRSKISWWAELLEARFRKAMPDVADRIVFLPQQDSAGFLNLLAASDVMLDTIHFNGMNTSLEAFSAGTPIVTLPTEFQRGRHTAGMYRKMGITGCIAADRNDYVRIAVKLGTEEDYRRHAKDEILRRNEVLFEDMHVVREFERCFLETVDRPRFP
jgi:predicted O-linked N-acetylglucosamine transferase (SPINDLY family)